jgi:hypothetical protein
MHPRMKAHFKVCAHRTAALDGTRNIVKLVGDGVAYELPAGFSRRLSNKIGGATQIYCLVKSAQDLSARDLAEGERLLLSEQEQWSTTG